MKVKDLIDLLEVLPDREAEVSLIGTFDSETYTIDGLWDGAQSGHAVFAINHVPYAEPDDDDPLLPPNPSFEELADEAIPERIAQDDEDIEAEAAE